VIWRSAKKCADMCFLFGFVVSVGTLYHMPWCNFSQKNEELFFWTTMCASSSASPGHTPSCVNLCCCSLTLLVIIYVVVVVIICSIACVLIRVTCLICVIIESLIFNCTLYRCFHVGLFLVFATCLISETCFPNLFLYLYGKS